MPFYIQEKNQLTYKLLKFVKQKNIILITGAPAYKLKGKNINWYNRAYLLADGKIVCYYDKIHLVPFGEYIPLANLFPFLTKLVEGPGDFFPGNWLYPLKIKDLAIGTLICYEITFPDLVTQMILNKGELLVNISNDAWFGDTSAPDQHLHLALLRAVEQGRYLVRCTNTGISAIIDPHGRIISQTRLFADAFLSGEIKLLTKTTFFHRYYFAIHCLLILTALVSISWVFLKILKEGR
jgi:apolipoprotein N-acyltransferase